MSDLTTNTSANRNNRKNSVSRDDVEKNPTMTLDDIIDLSVVELYILNFLVRVAGNSVRFAVFNEINSRLERNKISRSSFYHSLKKLEDLGFIEINPNSKGKGSTVHATALARAAVKQNNIFSIWGNIDLGKITMELMGELSKTNLLQNGMLKNQLYASCDDLTNLQSLDLLKQPAKKTYILADDETYEIYLARGLDLPQTDIQEGNFMVRDNNFDRGIIAKYHPSSQLFGVSAKDILNEMTRVVKTGGQIILTSFDEFPITNNLILDGVMNDLFLGAYFASTNTESLQIDMKHAGISKVEFLRHKGYIVTIGTV